MKIEEEIFQKVKWDVHSLLNYGFKKEDEKLVYVIPFLDDVFLVRCIYQNEVMESHCLDRETMEEYIPIRRVGPLGEYASKVKESYTRILIDLKETCGVVQTFFYPQTNRIIEKVKEILCDDIHFLFKKDKETGVFLNEENKKWYGIIMKVDGERFQYQSEVEVLVLKSDYVSDLLKEEGFYPAYHMNKTHWISIILNETVEDSRILELLTLSKGSTLGIRGKREIHRWLIPSNPKYYDIISALEVKEDIAWNRHANIYPQDEVYLYVGKPYSSIMFKFKVTSIDEEVGIMELHLLEKYPQTSCTLLKMRQLGVNTPRGAREMPERLCKLLEGEM